MGIEVSDARVIEIEKLQKQIKRGDAIVGTGWERLEVKHRTEMTWFGTEAISAKNLIWGWNHPDLKEHFSKADVDSFEPEYLTLSQVNNSSI